MIPECWDIRFVRRLDDFGMQKMNGDFLSDFEQIIDDRYGDKALIIAGQLPVEDWYNVFQSELIAEACMDRLVNNKTIKFNLNGESLRKKVLILPTQSVAPYRLEFAIIHNFI